MRSKKGSKSAVRYSQKTKHIKNFSRKTTLAFVCFIDNQHPWLKRNLLLQDCYFLQSKAIESIHLFAEVFDCTFASHSCYIRYIKYIREGRYRTHREHTEREIKRFLIFNSFHFISSVALLNPKSPTWPIWIKTLETNNKSSSPSTQPTYDPDSLRLVVLFFGRSCHTHKRRSKKHCLLQDRYGVRSSPCTEARKFDTILSILICKIVTTLILKRFVPSLCILVLWPVADLLCPFSSLKIF